MLRQYIGIDGSNRRAHGLSLARELSFPVADILTETSLNRFTSNETEQEIQNCCTLNRPRLESTNGNPSQAVPASVSGTSQPKFGA